MILHIISWSLLSVAAASAVYYYLRWNDSDEDWLHRMGECTHSKESCGEDQRTENSQAGS